MKQLHLLHSKSKQAQGLTPEELANSISKKFNQNKEEFNMNNIEYLKNTVEELENMNFDQLCDYYIEETFDTQYVLDNSMRLSHIRLMIACGGPNVYIDTQKNIVELYWGMDYEAHPIEKEICRTFERLAEEELLCKFGGAYCE